LAGPPFHSTHQPVYERVEQGAEHGDGNETIILRVHKEDPDVAARAQIWNEINGNDGTNEAYAT